jgi:hypothetical protein
VCQRSGGSGLMKRAFAGFKALPVSTSARPWWQTLGFNERPDTYAQAKSAYRRRIAERHDQQGVLGDEERVYELNKAIELAREHFGVDR